jgi:uncharacterized integral membrane protein
VAEVTLCLLPSLQSIPHLREWENVISITGAAGLGVSLHLIHIYVTPIKRFIQALYAGGTLAGIGLALTQAESAPMYVASHPSAVWLIGPLFAAITGLAFKEGVCYGKPEAAGLFFVTPALLLGHLSQWMPEQMQQGLLVVFTTLFMVFAARKYTQPIKDDIGDKSVFEFQKLSQEEQARRLAQMQQ